MTATAGISGQTEVESATRVTDTSESSAQKWALAAICLGAGILYVWTIGSAVNADAFYSAAVRSMSRNFTNFLFGSYDSAGVVTIDKPPLALWPQVVSVWIFGYHKWAELLPQVIEGVATVFLLHRTVRRWAGPNVALLAALILTITPVTVAVNRDNHPDTLLVLLLVAAAYAFTRSVQAETSRLRTRWLLWCAFFIGCGFVTKMVEAWIIMPGIALAFLLSADGPWKRRFLDVLAGAAVVIVSSFWWTALHDLWPGSPYMGGSTDGTALQLTLGYNGFGRLLDPVQAGSGAHAGGSAAYGVLISKFGGKPGIGRLFNSTVGGQISWLVPLALLALVVAAVAEVRRHRAGAPGDRLLRAGWLLWGSWLLVTALVFSFTQGDWHAYYTTMLAPAIAAIGAMGLALMWTIYRRDKGTAWMLLPAAVAVSAGWAFVLSTRVSSFDGWVRWSVVVAAAVGIAGLAAAKLPMRGWSGLAVPAAVVTVLSLMLASAAWSASATNGGNNPAAGPGGNPFTSLGAHSSGGSTGHGSGAPSIAPPPGFGGGNLTSVDGQILRYAEQQSGSAEIKLAIEGGSLNASRFLINADEPVIGLGGFDGADNAPSVDQLQRWVKQGKLKFVLGAGLSPIFTAMSALGGKAEDARTAWVMNNCTVIDPHVYGATTSRQPLYACRS
jgi:4-amino-4-deoxy-L-arabinose transferase-like glycosyltransferase